MTTKKVTFKKLPILGDIPIIGSLFRHKNQTKDLERELIIFITPHIVKDRSMLLAKAKDTNFPEKEEMPISRSPGRELAINESLNGLEKTK